MNQKKKAVNYPDAFKYQDVQNIWIPDELFFISFLPTDIFALLHDLVRRNRSLVVVDHSFTVLIQTGG